MKFIGITGGVGAGKSAILSYLKEKKNTKILMADEIAHELMEPKMACYEALTTLFEGVDVYENGKGTPFDRIKLASVIFKDEQKRQELNEIVHPAVKEYVQQQVDTEREKGEISYLFFEAALLIEEHYDAICDELWYIYTNETNRRERLKASRGYTDAKIDGILKSQLDEQTYRNYAAVIIDNNGSQEQAYMQIDEALRRKADE